ncbi:hypothetical protein JTB14_020335 [Gonioctena quinquepunctata]|nr:hypothetical protein JTB14_020335 [Gonioctena quinquepunctata]
MSLLVGTWEVLKCESGKGTYSVGYLDHLKCMEGIRVKLDENGDVTWTIPEELKSVPLFTCETYVLHRNCPRSGVVLRFGAYAGHVFEFTPEKWSKNNVTLTCEELCTLHCVRVNEEISANNYSTTFSLLPALEDGYFSDVTITASNKKQFKVHSSLLELQGDDIDWLSDPPPFSNISEDVVGTILHFLYAECLPDNLTEDTAREVITVVSPYKSLAKLVNNCQLYLKNMALKQQIISLVGDMHDCINKIIDRFHVKSNQQLGENVAGNPAELCFVVKQSIRDAAVAGAKLLLLCDLFSKRKNELTRYERHEIIRYAKSRLPIFLTQLMRFLQVLKNTFSSMSSAKRLEIATFLEPEVEVILVTISLLIVHLEKALQQIIQGLFTPDAGKCKNNVGDIILQTVRKLIHMEELRKLNTLHEHVIFGLGLILHKKETFNRMTSPQKVRSIARNLEQIIEELPIFVIRLEEIASVFEEKLEWRDFKFCFKVAAGKVTNALQKLLVHTESLQDDMLQLCELVQRDAFNQTLQCLGLLTSATSTYSSETPQPPGSLPHLSPKHYNYKLNLVKSLCVPKDANNSSLSHLYLQLLNSQMKTDMEFEVIGNNAEQTESSTSTEERSIIKSHRVIVAARCDWFRRALLSGMREAIDKKIIVHDTGPFLFRILLEYLYSGKVKCDSLTSEQLVELLLLSDRYEVDSLKHICEYALVKGIDADSVLYFTSVADQYNARILKSRCLCYVSQHHELTETEEFLELPIALQAQIFEDCILTEPSGKSGDFDSSLEYLLPASSANSPGSNDITRAMESMLLTPEPNHSNNSSLEDLDIDQNSSRMDTCISQLRDIVGEVAPRDILVQVILAADFDLQRAVNFYYAYNNGDE